MQATATLALETARTLATLARPALALGAIVALFVAPLWYLARSLGVC